MLGDQLIKYVSVKQKRDIQSDNFFVHSDGKSLAQQTSKMGAIINEIIQRQDSTGIRKYVIIADKISLKFLSTTPFSFCRKSANAFMRGA